MKWLFRKIKEFFFGKRPSVPTQNDVPIDDQIDVPDHVTTPTTGGNVVDRINNGNPKNPDHTFLFWNLEFDEDKISTIKWYANQYTKNLERYSFVTARTGVPEWFIYLLHLRESSLRFDRALHNGDDVIGNGRLTYRVPTDRGPFSSWEESAIDALKLKKYHKITDWSLSNILPKLEAWNGLGYRYKIGDKGKVEYSPFIVAGSSFHDETSKFVKDHVYDAYAREKQLGTFVVLRGLMAFADLKL